MIRKVLTNPKALFGVVVVLLFVFVAIFAPYLAPDDPRNQVLSKRLIPPAWAQKGSWEHPLGTDALGRDLLSRLIYGSRVSLIVGILGAASGFISFISNVSDFTNIRLFCRSKNTFFYKVV